MSIEAEVTGLLWLATAPAPGGSRYEVAARAHREASALRAMGVPDSVVWDAIRHDLASTTALDAASRWAAWPREPEVWEADVEPCPRSAGTLVLVGPVGTGKSLGLARLLLLRYRESVRLEAAGAVRRDLWRARWVDCRTLVGGDFSRVDRIHDLGEDGQRRREGWSPARFHPCIVLDDMSEVLSRGPARDALVAMISARHEAGVLTLVTSNLKRADLEAHVGPPLVDRIRQAGELVVCKGESLRAPGNRADLPAMIREAEQVVGCVRLLGRGREAVDPDKPIPDAVAGLTRAEAIHRLRRLLRVDQATALRAGEVARAEAARQAEEFARLRDRLAAELAT